MLVGNHATNVSVHVGGMHRQSISSVSLRREVNWGFPLATPATSYTQVRSKTVCRCLGLSVARAVTVAKLSVVVQMG